MAKRSPALRPGPIGWFGPQEILVKQSHGVQEQAIREAAEDAKAWIPDPALNLGDEGAINVGVQRQFLLSQAELRPPALDARRERLPG